MSKMKQNDVAVMQKYYIAQHEIMRCMQKIESNLNENIN